jgi:hypothetical protein
MKKNSLEMGTKAIKIDVVFYVVSYVRFGSGVEKSFTLFQTAKKIEEC